MNTPDLITVLQPGEVFVFGSNELGLHGGGAAAIAVRHFGAVWGEGEGLQGDSYAIPTMSTIHDLAAAVSRFLGFAGAHPELRFLVTKIGTGIAGHQVADVARFFAIHPENVILPAEFEQSLAGI